MYSCSQPIDPPSASIGAPFQAQDFFWQGPNLQRGIDYNVIRNGAPQEHILTSQDNIHVYDAATNGVALKRTGTADSILIDSMGANSIFSLPAGYFFGKDSARGSLLLLYRPQMDSGKTWNAGTLSGPGLTSGVPIIARVLDRDDTLHIPPVRAGADSVFGDSFRIAYTPMIGTDTLQTAPFYWVVYFAKNVGPVLIEQLSYKYDMRYTLGDQAQLIRRF